MTTLKANQKIAASAELACSKIKCKVKDAHRETCAKYAHNGGRYTGNTNGKKTADPSAHETRTGVRDDTARRK